MPVELGGFRLMRVPHRFGAGLMQVLVGCRVGLVEGMEVLDG